MSLRGYGAALFFVAITLLAGCSGADRPTEISTAPEIVISGVTEGTAYNDPVTITISIDRGAYQATLDGQPFQSGTAVKTPGAHTLSVNASNSLATSVRSVHFTISAPAGGVLIIRMLNLGANDDGGGGDAILLTDSSAAGMTHAMIDAGPGGANGSDPGLVARQLAQLHVDTLALLLLTHAHSDHFGGMPAIFSALKVRRFLYNGQVRNQTSYTNVVAQARNATDSVIVVNATRDYALGFAAQPAQLKVLPPLSTYLGTTTDDGTLINNGSVGTFLQLGTFTMFFTGDSEVEATARWRTQFSTFTRNLSVLKVGHHGANNAVFDDGFSGISAWLTQVAPTVSIISANGTTHPRINALSRLLAQPGNRTYCTNVHGTIEIRVTRTGQFTITVAANADKSCVAGSDATS